MSCFKVYSYHYYLSYSSFILFICFKRLYYFLLYKSLYFAFLKEFARDARKVASNKATALEVRPRNFPLYVLHIFFTITLAWPILNDLV